MFLWGFNLVEFGLFDYFWRLVELSCDLILKLDLFVLEISYCELNKDLMNWKFLGVTPPWAPRKFSQNFSPQSYNYYDYQNAWYNAFYFQNDRFQHSWFFYFDKHLEIQNLPAWFHHWWFQFGPEPSILSSKRLDEKAKESFERVYSIEQVYFPFSLT